MIDYTHRRRPRAPRSYRLFTTILDPAEAHRDRAGRRLHATLGDRARLRRAEDPPARTPHGAALEVPRPGPAGDLGTPVLPLRDPLADGRGRRSTPATTPTGSASSPRCGSPASHRPRGRFSPLTTTADAHGCIFLRRLLDRLNPARRHRATPARDQTQDAQMARQTRPPRRLAPTRRPPHLPSSRTN